MSRGNLRVEERSELGEASMVVLIPSCARKLTRTSMNRHKDQ